MIREMVMSSVIARATGFGDRGSQRTVTKGFFLFLEEEVAFQK